MVDISKGFYNKGYLDDPIYSDRQVWANSVDPAQTAPKQAVPSGSALFAFPDLYLFDKCMISKFKIIVAIFWVSEYLGFLQYIFIYLSNLIHYIGSSVDQPGLLVWFLTMM